MNAWFVIHRAAVLLLNAFFVGWILYIVITTNNDKLPALFMVFYTVLIVLNLVIAVILSFLKTRYFKIYRQIFLAELLLFIPLILIVTNL